MLLGPLNNGLSPNSSLSPSPKVKSQERGTGLSPYSMRGHIDPLDYLPHAMHAKLYPIGELVHTQICAVEIVHWMSQKVHHTSLFLIQSLWSESCRCNTLISFYGSNHSQELLSVC